MIWQDGWGAGNWLVMSVMMLLFWGLIIGFVVWLVRGRLGASQPDVNRARQILDERFARGEIDAEEYRQRRDHLTAL
jgi:putative membrane protein